MIRIPKILLSFLLFATFMNCSDTKEETYGFYYWRTQFKLNETEKKLLENSTSHDFYVRIYDIDKVQNHIHTVGKMQFKESWNVSKNVVPVVFIVNSVWISSTNEEKELLCNQLKNDVQAIEKQQQITINELQIDCDWTAQTREDYFDFLQKLKKTLGKKLSCTLRLHQVKDKEITGIPPVDKVYLMCYSTSSPLENSDLNSILDVTVLKNYLTKLNEYPITNIDFALPIYSWAIVTNHLGKKKLINALTIQELKDKNFIKLNETTYKVPEDGFYFGMYLSKDFTIKVEQISEESINEVKEFIEEKISYQHQFIYYHLDSTFTQNYSHLLP